MYKETTYITTVIEESETPNKKLRELYRIPLLLFKNSN